MSQGQDAGQHLQQLSEQLQELEGVQSQLRRQLQLMEIRQEEVDEAVDALDVLETDAVVQVPLGQDAWVKARIIDADEVIVDVGGDFAAEQTREGAIDLLSARSEQLEEQLETIEDNLSEVTSNIQQVQSQADQLRQQLLAQQTQQFGGAGAGGLGLGGQDS